MVLTVPNWIFELSVRWIKSDDTVTPAPTVAIPDTFTLALNAAASATVNPSNVVAPSTSRAPLASTLPLNVATPDTAISLNVENPAVLIPGTLVADDGRLVKFAP